MQVRYLDEDKSKKIAVNRSLVGGSNLIKDFKDARKEAAKQEKKRRRLEKIKQKLLERNS